MEPSQLSHTSPVLQECWGFTSHILENPSARAGLKAQFPHPSLETPIHAGVTPFPMILG